MKYKYILSVLFMLFGCATVTRGTHESLVVNTTPSGASVNIKEGEAVVFTGSTPTSAKLARKGNYVVTIEKDGYEPLVVNVTNEIATEGGVATAGNIIAGGCCGLGIDAGTGATLSLVPNPIDVELVPIPE